jgi:ABC-type antimicrobial peptide transport system permease subunit
MTEHRIVERVDRRTVGKQMTLPFSKALEISIKSLQIRFRRSLITVGLIMLAIAFLMTILTTNAFQNALVGRARAQVPRGDQVLAGVGDKEYVQADGTYYAVTTTFDSQAGKLVETSRQEVTDPKEKELAQKYLAALSAWQAATNELKMRLSKRGVLAEGVEAASIGITPQQKWIIILGLMLAAVGITNAMLMSVAERYREIGTMKCLGALDSFIIRLFLLESVFQGVAGTIVGVVVGFLLICFYTFFAYGWGMTLRTFPLATILIYSFWGFLLGFGLSVLGAILPALRAAKMQPVDAMRVEE